MVRMVEQTSEDTLPSVEAAQTWRNETGRGEEAPARPSGREAVLLRPPPLQNDTFSTGIRRNRINIFTFLLNVDAGLQEGLREDHRAEVLAPPLQIRDVAHGDGGLRKRRGTSEHSVPVGGRRKEKIYCFDGEAAVCISQRKEPGGTETAKTGAKCSAGDEEGTPTATVRTCPGYSPPGC